MMMAGEILGKKIVAVRQVFEGEVMPHGLDFSQSYLELETGRVLLFASSTSAEIESAVMPTAATRLAKKLERRIVGRRIVQVYRRMLDDEPDGEAIILALDDGTHVTETCVAPLGLGATGVHVYSAEEFERFFGGDVELFWKGDAVEGGENGMG